MSPKKTNGLYYTRIINRPLGLYLAKRLTFFSPDAVTLAAFAILTIACILLPKLANTWWAFIIWPMLVLNYALDSADGQLARVQGSQSLRGEWLDHTLDGTRIVLINCAFLVAVVLSSDFKLIHIGMTAFVICILSQVTIYVASNFRVFILKTRLGNELEGIDGLMGTVKKVLAAPADFGLFIIVSIFLVDLKLFVPIYAGYAVYISAVCLLTVWMTYRMASNKKSNK